MAWLWLLAACWLPSQVLAQSPGPDGGTLSPATSTVCSGFNSGTLTLTGFTGSILKYQADNGSGYVDIANTAPTYTFSNLQTTTSFRAVVQNGANPAVTSTVATVTVNQPPTATINSQGPTRFCQQGTIYLVAGPSGNFTYQFLRNGINIAGATSQVYSSLVTTSGSYSVRVTDAAGCSAISSSIQIQVQPQNVVNLSTNTPTTFCQGGSVLLSANVSGTGASGYTYQFLKDGNQIPGATNATYSATTSGSYTVVVDNPATCSSTSNAVTVTVTQPTVATINYPAASYCQSGATNPTATVTPTGGTFSSTAGLSLNTTTGTIALAQSQPGTYSVAYTSGGSCPGTASANITITAAPTAGFSYAGGSRCAGTTGTLTPTAATGATAGTYSASPAGLSLNAGTGAIDLSQSQPGSYTVTNTVAAANGCAAVSATTSVVLTAQPVATLVAGGATTFCQGGSVVLTASGGAAGATYQFLNNGQPVAGATNATFTASAGGSYSVVITNPGGCASTSAPTTVTVNPQTTATFSYSAGAYCQNSGTTPTPTITGTGGGAFTSAPAGLSSNASTGAINLAASTSGTYTVTYSVGGPCPSTSTASVTITAPAVATFSYASSSYCATGTTAATLATGGAAGTFTSTTGLSLNATTGTIDLSQSQPGTYAVTNTVAGGGGCAAASATATATLTINALPAQPTLTSSGTLLTASAAPGATYQFYLNGVAVAGATNATYTATQSGSYTVVVTNATGCASLPSAPVAVVVVVTAARTGLAAANLTVFPNPTTGRLTVTLSGRHSRAQLAVYNALGQVVLTGTLTASAATGELDLTTLATGVYVLKVTSTEGSVTRRLMRQ
ncbi:hypothetical protein BEN48_12680 [Hymenobacter glacialis]|uniref:Secretion system C-terminal sorting domain-containing protein n=2 Tax=Hymenobacter glacialis TaxID=1908236 RepID=A0A1G1T6P0_9BACT|nr:hypothetical protein BEN48_12680 [Hymenobacter glacialis]